MLLVAAGVQAQERTLTLAEARALLRSQNLSVQAAAQGVSQTSLLTDQARTLLRPRLEATASYTLRDQEIAFETPNVYAPLVPFLQEVRDQFGATNPDLFDPQDLLGGGGEPAIIQQRHDVRGSVTLTQSLFNIRALPLLRQAEIAIEQAQNGVDQTAWQLEGGLLDAWFAACTLQRYVEITQQNRQIAQLNADRAQTTFELGVGNLFEVNRALVDVSVAERDIANAQASYRLVVRQIATLLNTEANFEIVQPVVLDPASQVDVDGLVQQTVTLRPDLAGLALAAQFHEQAVREKQWEFWPTVAAQAAANVQRESAFGGDRFSWSISVFATWLLYDGGLRASQQRGREYDQEIVTTRQREALVQIRSQIEALVIEIEQAQNDATLASQQAELAARNVQLTEAALDLGAATSLDLQYATQQRFLSELAVADAEVRLQQKLYQLQYVTGQLGAP